MNYKWMSLGVVMILGMVGDASAMVRSERHEYEMLSFQPFGDGEISKKLFERIDFTKPLDERIIHEIDQQCGRELIGALRLDGYSKLLDSMFPVCYSSLNDGLRCVYHNPSVQYCGGQEIFLAAYYNSQDHNYEIRAYGVKNDKKSNGYDWTENFKFIKKLSYSYDQGEPLALALNHDGTIAIACRNNQPEGPSTKIYFYNFDSGAALRRNHLLPARRATALCFTDKNLIVSATDDGFNYTFYCCYPDIYEPAKYLSSLTAVSPIIEIRDAGDCFSFYARSCHSLFKFNHNALAWNTVKLGVQAKCFRNFGRLCKVECCHANMTDNCRWQISGEPLENNYSLFLLLCALKAHLLSEEWSDTLGTVFQTSSEEFKAFDKMVHPSYILQLKKIPCPSEKLKAFIQFYDTGMTENI